MKAFRGVLWNVYPEVKRLHLFFDEACDLPILRGILQSFFDLKSHLDIEADGFVDSDVRDKLMQWQANATAARLGAGHCEPQANDSCDKDMARV